MDYENQNKQTGEISWEAMQHLSNLDENEVSADGVILKPSQCYRIEAGQVLFNTNCPDIIKHRVELILKRFPAIT